METLLRNSTLEQLRNYFYDERGEYPPSDFKREEIIQTILKSMKRPQFGTVASIYNKLKEILWKLKLLKL